MKHGDVLFLFRFFTYYNCYLNNSLKFQQQQWQQQQHHSQIDIERLSMQKQNFMLEGI